MGDEVPGVEERAAAGVDEEDAVVGERAAVGVGDEATGNLLITLLICSFCI